MTIPHSAEGQGLTADSPALITGWVLPGATARALGTCYLKPEAAVAAASQRPTRFPGWKVMNWIFTSSIHMIKNKRDPFQRVKRCPSPHPHHTDTQHLQPQNIEDTAVFGPSSSKLCREPDLHISRRTEHQNGWFLLMHATKDIYQISFSNSTENKLHF